MEEKNKGKMEKTAENQEKKGWEAEGNYSKEEEEEIKERLRSLGYL